MTAADARHMRHALELARRGSGTAWPNPMVGAVVVQDGAVVGQGWHERPGQPHAEVHALRDAGGAARGATLYVTLEPCSHHGRTPPCTRAIIEAGIARVVFGAADPNPAARGGADRLRAAGIAVVADVEREAARSLNAAFFHVHEGAPPFIAIKLAMSLDGGIAAAAGSRSQITGPAAAEETHRLRAQHDAILIGSRTARIDDPLLTVRGIDVAGPPVRVVIDTEASLTPTSQLVRTVGRAPVHVLCAVDAADDRVAALSNAGVTVTRVPRAEPHGTRTATDAESVPAGLDLDAVRAVLAAAGVRAVLVEGGGTLASAFLDAGMAHRLYLFIAPHFLGAGAVRAFCVRSPSQWRRSRVEELGDDVLITLDRAAMTEEPH